MPRKDSDFPTSPNPYPPVALPRGAAALIARRVRPPVTVQHVCEVAKGVRKATRVREAIERYLARQQDAKVAS